MDVRVMDNVHSKMATIIVNALTAGPVRIARYRSRWTAMMESIMTKVTRLELRESCLEPLSGWGFDWWRSSCLVQTLRRKINLINFLSASIIPYNPKDGMIDCSDSECCSHSDCSEHIMCLSSNEPVEVLLRKQPPSVTASFFQRVKFLIEENGVQSYAQINEYSERWVISSFQLLMTFLIFIFITNNWRFATILTFKLKKKTKIKIYELFFQEMPH